MFNQDFFPTPPEVIDLMLAGEIIRDKVVLEPSAGKGDIVEYCIRQGAKDVIACELNNDLRKIVQSKCKVIANDFLSVKSEDISHVDYIIMNPPFSADEKHILHAYKIAPEGCMVVALCNLSTLENRYTRSRGELFELINIYGYYSKLGNCFSNAERNTDVEIALVKLKKPGGYESEFDGFFMYEDEEAQSNGIMPYSFVRDLVNRYVGAVKIYDQQLEAAVKMNILLDGFYESKLAFSCTEEGKPKHRSDFKKDLQKSAWNYIFEKMQMEKYTTKGLKEDINKFVEQQQHIPFTMRNIYRMIEIVIGTHSQRMDRALLEVFDRLTTHYHDNRYSVPGWKTNSHYLINQKFILPNIAGCSYSSGFSITHYDYYTAIVDDMVKALCHITGKNYDDVGSLWSAFNSVLEEGQENEMSYKKKYKVFEFGQWYEWGFFRVKAFKKQTMHFEFLDLDVWAKFNQHISRLKGYPLFEGKEQTKWQKRQNKTAA